MKTVEIICRNCGADTLLQREAVYDGFTKIGEKRSCSACAFEYATEADVPFKEIKAPPIIFTDADRSAAVDVFDEGESNTLCHHCANYIVNPFTQFCSIHKKEVQATDSCSRFVPAEEKTADDLF
ncbi:MAG: hypothetical protein V5783_10980 [Pontiella sp.]